MPINVGGDDSVKWVVNAPRPKEAYSDPPPQANPPGLDRSYYHEGTSLSDAGERFWIRIRLPRNGEARFLDELVASVQNPVGGAIVFSLPIEDSHGGNGPAGKTEDQITIDWGKTSPF